MNDSELKEIFFNKVEERQRISCDNCFEHMVFMLSDSQQRRFSIGINTILECLVFAISSGDLPKLPQSWLADVDNVYNTSLSLDESISYNDYEIYSQRNKSE